MYFIGATVQSPAAMLPETCSQGHGSNFIISTAEGGSICLLCFSNLLNNPKSPTVHVSYALSQLSQALFQPHFLHSLLAMHSHLLISPLLDVLSNFDDEPIAKQTIDLIQRLCDASNCNGGGNSEVYKEFVSRVSDWLSNGSLGWSRRQFYMLHCFGVLLEDGEDFDVYNSIKNKDGLIYSLVTGLQFCNDQIQGEILFVMYRLSLLCFMYVDDSGIDCMAAYFPKIFKLSLEILVKSQSDDVRLNCIAFLLVLAKKGLFQSGNSKAAGSMDTLAAGNLFLMTEPDIDGRPLVVLFAEAVKGPLLSSDIKIQTATLDLVFMYLSGAKFSENELNLIIKEDVADYIFEVLRLSGNKDPIVNSAVQVLDLLSCAEQSFRPRLAIGFSTLVPILQYVATISLHPMQCHILKLVLNFVSSSPGLVSSSTSEEISSILAGIFSNKVDILPETFNLSCSLLVAIMKCTSSRGNSSLVALLKDALTSVISTCMENAFATIEQILHSLYFLKEAYAYEQEDYCLTSSVNGLRPFILKIFKLKILPWFIQKVSELEDEAFALGLIEILIFILVQDFNTDTISFAEHLASSSWFSVSFGCLGMFPSNKMKLMVYLSFHSLIDVLLGSEYGKLIKDAALHLPSDPKDLLFLLGQKSYHNLELYTCQSAILLVLYVSSLYDDRIADDNLVLASLEQFILLNFSDFLCEASSFVTADMIVNLYGLYRGFAKASFQIPYSPEAERILFGMLCEGDWDLFSCAIHFISLRWLLQQEKLCLPLSSQILNFCKSNLIGDRGEHCAKAAEKVDLHVLAELVALDDNFGAFIFVCLLRDLLEVPSQNYEIILVVKVCKNIVEIAPGASDRFHVHGIDAVLHDILRYSLSFQELFVAASQFIFTLLKYVQSESISNSGAWMGMSKKFLEYMFPSAPSHGWNNEALLGIGILSLILHHSTAGVLKEACKAILLNTSLAMAINASLSDALSNGSTLFNGDKGTRTGETLICFLVLLFFSIRSIRAILLDVVELQSFIDEDAAISPLCNIRIRCHDLCKLLHYGPLPVKLIASSCLVELFSWISDHTYSETSALKFRDGYLLSTSSIIGGMIFYSDIRVAMNCSRCLSSLLSMNDPENTLLISQHDLWLRVIIEELMMYLGIPSLTPKSSNTHYKPALNVAAAFMKLSEVPPWMIMLFGDSCVSNIIKNMTPSCPSIELVIVFRRLLELGQLNSVHIADLNKLFHACRRHVYDDVQNGDISENHVDRVAESVNDAAGVYRFLLSMVSAQSCPRRYEQRFQWRRQLLEEIDLFMKCVDERALNSES